MAATPHSTRLTLILGALTAFPPLSIDIYLPSLPTLVRTFGTTDGAVQLTLPAFFLGLALGQLFYGPLSDRYGRRPALLVGIALYTLASAACAAAPSIEALLAGRFVQALGGSAGMTIAMAVVRDRFDPREGARTLSLLMLVMGVAPILAPLVGGWILVLLGWQAIFWVLALFGLICFLAVLLALPESRPANAVRPGSVGAALATYAGLIGDRRFLGFALAGGFTISGMFAYITGSPTLFIDGFGVPAEDYGWIFGANAAGIIGVSQLNRRLLLSHPGAHLLRAAVAVNAAAGIVLLATGLAGAGLAVLLVPLFVAVATVGAVLPNSTSGALAAYPEKAGAASALIGSCQLVLGALASSLVGAFGTGTAVPMAAVIAGCGAVAFLVTRVAANR
ncbi:MAG TPA: Bcr/CflA family multidrug efflux MFS transporter [Alphaproteobacteria bacterium]|nr:Bcr/CflA family multidrug efflux MFS transporter [Alphaproteobacteria bacterium]